MQGMMNYRWSGDHVMESTTTFIMIRRHYNILTMWHPLTQMEGGIVKRPCHWTAIRVQSVWMQTIYMPTPVLTGLLLCGERLACSQSQGHCPGTSLVHLKMPVTLHIPQMKLKRIPWMQWLRRLQEHRFAYYIVVTPNITCAKACQFHSRLFFTRACATSTGDSFISPCLRLDRTFSLCPAHPHCMCRNLLRFWSMWAMCVYAVGMTK
jgi:hypothetical protein